MEEFPPNSHKSQNPKKEKQIVKVVTTDVITRKKPLGRKFKEIFFGGDFKSTAFYVTTDVILPAIKNMIVDASIGGIERVVYGETRSQRRRSSSEYRPRVSYNNPMAREPRDRSGRLPDQPPVRGRHDADQLILANREEAELVVERLGDILDQYEVASVADLYELIGAQSSHIDHKWGWTSIKSVEIKQLREGYLLDLPPAEPI